MSNKPRPTYAPLALARLQKVGEKSILKYFKQVPPVPLKLIGKLLPAVPGFRPGTAATLERQLQTLANKLAQGRLTKSFARSKDEIGLYAIWRAWSERYLAPTTVTDNLFEGLETEMETEGPDSLPQIFIDALTAYSTASDVDQGTLIQFVTMSPFDDIAEMMAIARGAKTAAQIQETADLKELPTRLRKDEGAIHDLEDRVAAIEAILTEPPTEAPDSGVLTTVSKDLADIRTAISGEADKVRLLSETVDQLSKLVDQHSDKARSFDHALTESVNAAADAANKAGLRLDDAESNILSLMEYETRLAALETARKVDNIPVAKVSASAHEGPFYIGSRGAAKPAVLGTIEAVLGALKAALQGEGLAKSAAEIFAQEMLAAASAKQAIFLKGAFARDVAAACARSLMGSAVARLPIALGANQPWAGSVNSLWGHPDLEGKAAIAVIVENVNDAAMAISYDGIADLLTSRIDDGRPASVVFATLIDSPAAFPLEKLYLRLGPVFDLDLMEWRGKRAKLMNPGELTVGAIAAVYGLVPPKPIDFEETRRLSALVAGKRDPGFEQIVDDAFSALSQLRSENAEFTAIQSLQFGWLLPYWMMRSPQLRELDAEIDGGRCDGKKADGRLKRALDEYTSANSSNP